MIKKDFDKIFKIYKKLEQENKRLKEQIITLNNLLHAAGIKLKKGQPA